MTTLARIVPFAVCLTLAGCCKKPGGGAAHKAPEDVPQTPISLAAEPAWPLPPGAAVERVVDRRPGTSGTFVLTDECRARVPVRGALVPWHDGSTSFRVHRPFAAAPVGDGDWFLVLADSGLWLLESKTMAVRARLFASATGDVSASADGKRFAFATCDSKACFVEIRTFPGLETIWRVAAPEPRRLRFTSDGALLAVASARQNAAMVIDVEGKTSVWLNAGNDVNDALILSAEKKWIAWGTDSDEAVIVNWETEARLFSTEATMLARAKRAFDQNAMAYDAAKDEWLVGGNDDVVWRFGAARSGSPYYVGRVGFANDVEDLALLSNGDVLVGLDCGSIDILRADGSTTPGIGRSVGLSSWGARVNVDAQGSVYAVLGGTVLRWTPGDPLVKQSPFFVWDADWQKNYTKSDVVLIGARGDTPFSYLVQRASLQTEDPLSVEARLIGELAFETHSPAVGLLDDGTRLIVGKGPGETLRVYRLPLGGALSEAEDSGVPYHFGAGLSDADGKRFGYESGRTAAQIDGTRVRVLGTLSETESLTWREKKSRWEACDGRRCRALSE